MDQFQHLATLPPELAIVAASAVLEKVATDDPHILDHLPSSTGRNNGPAFAQLNTATQGVSLQVFVWPSGIRTPIHDHTSWGIYLCLRGVLREDRYERLDDGREPAHAHLRHAWRALWRPGQQSSLLPYGGGIHRVGNPSDRPAISLHLYGPRQAATDGRDYDPTRDFVCDRPLEALPALAA